MKKLFKIAITCILFCVMTIEIYATTEILSQNEFGTTKVAIFGASVFLVQILFSAYKKDIVKEHLEIFKPDELKKLLKEEENLFTEIHIDEEIETIQDKGIFEKKNITLKKEVEIEKVNKDPSRPKRPARGYVKIVRERKNRNLDLEPKEKTTVLKQDIEAKKKKTKSEGKSKTREIKNSSESRKRAKKVLGEEKNKNL